MIKSLAIGMFAVVGAGIVTPVFASEPTCVALTRGFWVDVFVERNAEAANKYLSPDYIQHVAPPQPLIADWVDVWRGVFATPPTGPGAEFAEAQADYTTDITSIIGNEDYAVLRAHDYGVWSNGPDVGKPFDFRYYDIFRCENGLLAEHWYSEDPDPSVGQ
jgi:predicted SnoaL-like aldol condensation-catalyzing enzyme